MDMVCLDAQSLIKQCSALGKGSARRDDRTGPMSECSDPQDLVTAGRREQLVRMDFCLHPSFLTEVYSVEFGKKWEARFWVLGIERQELTVVYIRSGQLLWWLACSALALSVLSGVCLGY